ncbi:MAG: PAS domain-containing sensor histidine kinase [Paracoccaceae bacterium]|nr:MAG: PAS domain-containing sensor histidine kinase [Paracoccaceae bacterium]
MSSTGAGRTWDRLSRLRRQRRVQAAMTFGLVVLGPVLALGTFLILGPMNQGANSPALRLILLADFVYVLVVAALVLARVARMISDRRSQSAGSRLHLRLSGVFAFVALVPTVIVAVFAVLTVNVGLEGWFSQRVRDVVGTSLAAAQAYDGEHRRDLTEDTGALAAYLNVAKQSTFFLADDQLRPVLTQGQAAIQRGLKEVFLIDGAGTLMTRGERSYLFDFETPPQEVIDRARETGETVLIDDWPNDELRAVVHLDAYADRYLYVTRTVDGSILSLLDDTRETVRLYQQLESERGRLLFEFGLLYLGFALILILAAVWLGLSFAERLSRPVGRLASAAQRVGGGDLDVQVPEEDGDDEIAMMGRLFNRMTRQLKAQREALVENTRAIEGRRRLFDSVLSSVTAGVIGLDAEGRIDFVNRAGERLLDMGAAHGLSIDAAVPEFAPLFERLRDGVGAAVQEEVRLTRKGRMESLLVRMAGRRSDTGRLEGYVVAFDDVTDLVSAQRMAAWGDVARRIAHEIKNPLTPIQLSAERIKRKFRGQVDNPDDLDQYADVIVRQTGDLRRIVDEFSKFARMPEPDRREEDIVRLVRDAVTLQTAGMPGVRLVSDLPEGPVTMDLDATMIGQALTNLIKNAGEAIETLQQKGAPDGHVPEVRVALETGPDQVVIRICDNGTGLPPDRARLFEPYVTTREKGTGLGLPIVRKIIEEHGGTLALEDADPFAPGAHPGAMAVIRLPRLVRAARRRGAAGQAG